MTPTVRALRRQVREWRRGRADARLVDVLGDAYIAAFAVLMLGSILVNVVIGLGRSSDAACTSRGCVGARDAMPVVVALLVLATVVGVGRLLGPVTVTPAVGSWLLPSPLDRAALLRPRALFAALVAGSGGAAVTLGACVVGGLDGATTAAVTSLVGLLGPGVVGGLAHGQRTPRRRAGSAVWWLPAVLAWGGLLAIAAGVTDGLGVVRPGIVADVAVPVVGGLLAVLVLGVGLRGLRDVPTAEVVRGGALTPGLSGALASLDPALGFDVLVEHRWRRHPPVRSRRPRRGPRTGRWALVRADLIRLGRTPRPALVLAALTVVPYAAERAGVGRGGVLVAPLVGFVAGVPLLTGLRVLERTPSLARMLPFPVPVVRTCSVAVPAVLLLGFGIACAPGVTAARHASDLPLLWGAAIGASALAASVRWMTARPPDYARPLISSPAGGVPTNLYGSALRGFDVVLVSAAPLLLPMPTAAVELSLAVSAAVLVVLLVRQPS